MMVVSHMRMHMHTLTLEPPHTPLSLRLQVLETEERFPSVRCQVTCTVRHPTGKFTYEASDVWFESHHIDHFITELDHLTRGTGAEARLHDLSEAFVLTLARRDPRRTTLALSIFEPSPEGAEARMSLTTNVDHDVPAVLLHALRSQRLSGGAGDLG